MENLCIFAIYAGGKLGLYSVLKIAICAKTVTKSIKNKSRIRPKGFLPPGVEFQASDEHISGSLPEIGVPATAEPDKDQLLSE